MAAIAQEPASFAQFGEDVALLEFFGREHRGYFVDVGANDGIRDSNTALLERGGWTGVLVDANPRMVERARAGRRATVVHRVVTRHAGAPAQVFYCVSGGPENLNGLSTAVPGAVFRNQIAALGGIISEVEVPAATLTEILDHADAPRQIDLLSVDVEGAEDDAFRGLDFGKYAPRIILAEDNSRGADSRVAAFLATQGYRRVHRTGVNDWYVRKPDTRRFRRERLMLRLRLLKWAAQRCIQSTLGS